MKKLFVILAVLAAFAAGAAAQDQVLVPVLVDANNVIIKPNPEVLAVANNFVMTSDPLYAFITNDALVAAATGAVETIASLSASITNLPASSITSGNLAVARLTNAAATVGASIGGNIPVAALTNAAGSIGASIGGNIPAAALTNALAANLGTVDYTNVIVSADSKTNTIIVINGLVTSWVVTE